VVMRHAYKNHGQGGQGRGVDPDLVPAPQRSPPSDCLTDRIIDDPRVPPMRLHPWHAPRRAEVLGGGGDRREGLPLGLPGRLVRRLVLSLTAPRDPPPGPSFSSSGGGGCRGRGQGRGGAPGPSAV